MALSQSALQAVLASATSKTFLECITISNSQMATLRLVNDAVNMTREDGLYVAFPFTISAATQSQDRPPAIDITADAVDQRIVSGLRQLAGSRERAGIRYEIVLSDTPDQVEFGPVNFEFDALSGDSLTQVTLRASFMRGALNDAFPALQFTPSNVG